MYWIADPTGPTLTVLEIVEGEYAEVARLTGGETASLERPFPVTARL